MTDHTTHIEQTAQAFRHDPKEYPHPDDLVICQVTTFTDVGFYVSLLEYGGIEGLISITDWTARGGRAPAPRHLTGKEGQLVVARVTRIDHERGYIDLTRRSLPSTEVEQVKERWNNTRAVRSLLVRLLRRMGRGMDALEEAQREWIWPMYHRYGHPYHACMTEITTPLEWGMPNEIQEAWRAMIRERLTPSTAKVRCEMDLRCYHPDGIEVLKDVIRRALAKGEGALSVHLIASPYYSLTMTCDSIEQGMGRMALIQQDIKAGLAQKHGVATIRLPTFVVGRQQEEELHQRLEALDAERRAEEEAEWD